MKVLWMVVGENQSRLVYLLLSSTNILVGTIPKEHHHEGGPNFTWNDLVLFKNIFLIFPKLVWVIKNIFCEIKGQSRIYFLARKISKLSSWFWITWPMKGNDDVD